MKVNDFSEEELVVIQNALENYLSNMGYSLVPQDQEYLKMLNAERTKAMNTLEKVRELRK